jgi:predicted Zn-dependent protease
MAALRINENIADAHEYLALASFKKNDYEKAEQHFLKALSLEPENFTYIYNATNFYIQVNKIFEAEQLLTNLIEKNNYNNKQINILLIDLYSKSQQWEKLINFADHLKNLYPDEKEYYYALAESYIRTGNYLFAKNIVKEILLKHPEDSVGLQLQKILEEQ